MILFFSPPTRRAHSETPQPRSWPHEQTALPIMVATCLYDDERFQALVKLLLPPNGKPRLDVSAGLSVLADAARFPATWFYLGT
jgi:hypothetical protein